LIVFANSDRLFSFLDLITDIYQLTPSSVWGLRERVVTAVRAGVRKPTRIFLGDQVCREAAVDISLEDKKAFHLKGDGTARTSPSSS